MVDPALQSAIEAIHAARMQLVFEFTGAGSPALAALHAVPGSSRTILEATDRYGAESLAELLGRTPEKSVDPATAEAMAERAYLRACRLGGSDARKLGLACTAGIATDRARRGPHRCCLAARTADSMTTFDLVLAKGQRDRAGEEAVITSMIVDAIAIAAGTAPVAVPLLSDEKIIRDVRAEADPVEQLLAGAISAVTIDGLGRRISGAPPGVGLVYPGSFNPLHFGHESLAAAAERICKLPLIYELAVINAEKSPLQRPELERRLAPFWRRHPVALTRAPLFADKAALFPGATFILGFDTAARLLDTRFYGGSESARDQALAAIGAAGCRVLVAGRLDGATFRKLSDLSIPAAFKSLFIELAESDFRADISATYIRSSRPMA
ncbi:MAG: hypothetical protein ABSH22_12295 [Tepidisphaeraceae bacterium]|jgi:hypothetical protein